VIELRKYVDRRGRCPLDSWIGRLRDARAEARIAARLTRLSLGLEGDWKPVGEGVRELRIPEGPGYRIYYAWDGRNIVVLLAGGTKSSQRQDIENAQAYWSDYRDRT
jgi:putative addiction module killer protein